MGPNQEECVCGCVCVNYMCVGYLAVEECKRQEVCKTQTWPQNVVLQQKACVTM